MSLTLPLPLPLPLPLTLTLTRTRTRTRTLTCGLSAGSRGTCPSPFGGTPTVFISIYRAVAGHSQPTSDSSSDSCSDSTYTARPRATLVLPCPYALPRVDVLGLARPRVGVVWTLRPPPRTPARGSGMRGH